MLSASRNNKRWKIIEALLKSLFISIKPDALPYNQASPTMSVSSFALHVP